MKRVDLPYSGKYGFAETEMYWPINHMVAPKTNTVQCIECHTRHNGRLAGLNDFYMPGRNYSAGLEKFGAAMILMTLAGVIAHGVARIVTNRKRKGA
jgi:hypothetical protein